MWDGALAGMLGDELKRQSIKHQTLADLASVQGMVGKAQDREAQLATREREAAFRSKLSELVNPTHDQVRNLALQSGLVAPKDVLTNDLGMYRADTNKDLARARIDAAQLQHDRMYEIQLRNAKTAEQRASLDAWYKQGKMKFDAARAAYGLPPDLVPSVDPFQAAPETPAVPSAPIPAKPTTPPADVAAGVAELNANVPQQIAAAAPIVAREGMPNGGGAIPTSAVIGPDISGGYPDAASRQVAGGGLVSPPSAVSPVETSKYAGMTNVPTAPETPKPANWSSMSRKAQEAWLANDAKARQKADVNLAGGRESVYINRIVNAANQAASDLENVAKLPITVDRGLFGGRGQGKSLFEAAKETLANSMTTQEVQTYNVLATGFQRALATLEAQGLAPNAGLAHQMDAIIFKDGDTNFTKLQKLAQIRQIVEKGMESTLANGRIPESQKTHIEAIIKKVEKAVPFTQADLIELQQKQQINPNITLNDIVKMKSAGSYPTATNPQTGETVIYKDGKWQKAP